MSPWLAAMGTPLTNKYAEGYPGAYSGGCEYAMAGPLAIDPRRKVFWASCHVQAHSVRSRTWRSISRFLARATSRRTVALWAPDARRSVISQGVLFALSRTACGRILATSITMPPGARAQHRPRISGGAPRVARNRFAASATSLARRSKLMVDRRNRRTVAKAHPSCSHAYAVTRDSNTARSSGRTHSVPPACEGHRRDFPGIQGGPLMH